MVQTQVRLLLKKQYVQGLLCLLFDKNFVNSNLYDTRKRKVFKILKHLAYIRKSVLYSFQSFMIPLITLDSLAE